MKVHSDPRAGRVLVRTKFKLYFLLRCAAAVLVGSPRPEAIVQIPGETVRSRFDEVVNGVLGAIDFLEMNFGIRRIDNLPFQTILVPLSVFFAISGNKHVVVTQDQRARLIKWFWKVSFARRYSSGVIRHLEEDITAMLQLKGGQQSNLGAFSASVDDAFFVKNTFGIRNVNAKTFVMMLAQQKPMSFVSGTPVDLNSKLKEYNKAEFHHMMPRAFLKGVEHTAAVDCLANFCFLSRSENKDLGGVAPSKYRSKMPSDVTAILSQALCPESIFDDEFDKFVAERAALLAEQAAKLICLEGRSRYS